MILLLLPVSLTAYAQESRFDTMLDRYEFLCHECLQLRLLTALGEDVSKNEAQSLINGFLTLNKGIKSVESELSPAQRRRFSAISRWFTTGKISQLPEHETIPKLENIALSNIHVDHDIDDVIPYRRDVKCVRNPQMTDVFILATSGAPEFSYGLMAGYKYARFGGYMGFRSNYSPCRTSYLCTSDSKISTGGAFWASGASAANNFSLNAGPMLGLNKDWAIFVGLGYGQIKHAWEDVDGQWALVSDLSFSGISAESGLIFSSGKFAFLLGVQTIMFQTVAAVGGVGVRL